MKSTARIGIGAILFVTFIAITWAISNNGLKAQSLNDPSPPSMVVQSSAPVEAKLSRPVSELPTGTAPQLDREINTLRNPGLFKDDLGLTGTDTNKQDALAALSQMETGTTAPPLFTFEGLGTDGYTPPDTVGEVGPNHYVQMVNVSFAVFDKTGSTLQADTAFTELFAGSGLTACATENNGDPIVVYDELADRWLLSQFAVDSGNRMCIAISQTADPTGAFYLYQFNMPDFPDYFKFGVWSDAYYMSTNTGFPNQYYAYAFDRDAMIAGSPATYQYSNGHPNFMMPADLDGATPPPAGSPGYFYTMLSDGYPDHPVGVDRLAFYEFDVDWATPANSTFTLADQFPIAAYNYTVCGFFVGDCIDQPGTAQGLDSLSYWPMFRFGYRNLGAYEALVGNFTVDLDGTNKAAIRWFELQNSGSGWGLYQEGTHAPDSDHRWMGSIAMDASGNIGLGYSVSSDTTIPAIRYATRLRTDPLGTLQAEATMFASSGVHTGIHRWGDYSALSVDPADGCTFWYTNQYDIANNSGFDWHTRIGTFRVPECTGSIGSDFSLSAAPASQAVCAPTDAVYDIALNYVTGFNGSVALSAVNVPAGTTAVINPSSVVTPTMSSMMTLTVGATTAGSYDISIVGVSVPTPTHTTTVGLDVYTAAPSAIVLVTPADAAANVDLLPTLTWTADAQGNTYEVQVATDMAFTNIVYTDSLGATSSTVDVSLSPLTTYYWRVYGNNACGDGAWSAVRSFTTRDIPPILLVDDDDNGPDVRAFYTNALDALGAQYDIWDTNNTDTEPSAAELTPYSTVIWFTGDEFGGAAGPGASGETALATWLDAGNCLFLTSQDYFYDRAQTPFMTNYLGLASATSDNGDYTSVTGQGTVFSGYGPYTLDYGPVGTDYSDPLTPDGTAEAAFLGNNSKNAAIDKDSGVYRTTFWGFSYEAISTAADREEAMGVVLNWCGNGTDTGTLDGTVTDVDSGLGIEGATVTAGSRSVATDANGDYSMTLAVGDYDVTAQASNYVSSTVSAVSIITNTITTVDFALAGSALTYSPSEIEEWMSIGDVVTNSVTVTNTGPLAIDFQVAIGNFAGPGALLIPRTISIPVSDADFTHSEPSLGHAPEGIRGTSRNTAVQMAPLADSPAYGIDLIGDTFNALTIESPGTLTNLGAATADFYAGDFLNGDFTTLYTIDNATATLYAADTTAVTFTAIGSSPASGGQTWTGMAGDPTSGTMYAVSTDCANNTLYTLDVTTGAVTTVGTSAGSCIIDIAVNSAGEMYGLDILADNLLAINKTTGATTIIGSVGFDASYAQGMDFDESTDMLYLAAYNATLSAAQMRVADTTTGNTTLIGNIGAGGGEMDSFGIATGSGSSTIWAYASPDGGTVPANSTMTFDVVFDAQSAIMVGDYTAELTFSGTYVNVVPTMPLTMHLDCPTCGFMDGAITAVNTGLPVAADIHVTGGSGMDVTLTGENYALAVPAGNYDITVSASGYLSETASVTVTQGITTTTDFALIAAVAMLEYSESAIEEWMSLGEVVSNTVTVTNTGYVDMNFQTGIVYPVGMHAPTDVADGSFEGGTPNASWNEASTNFGSPLCDVGSCGTGTGTGPHSGNWWVWLGGIGTYEESSVDQDVLIPSGSATLTFFLEQIICDSANDYVEVQIDGAVVFESDGSSALCGILGYSEQTVDISAYADGGTHNIKFHSEIFATNGTGTNFFVDDVSITSEAGGGGWATAVPASGVVPAGGSVTFEVVFDAGMVSDVGDHTAELHFTGNFVNTPAAMPLTMHIYREVYLPVILK